jgi:signal transducing adaptor molecule
MFKGTQPNPYDDIVVKATDETLTSENWELILNLCDKVQDEGEQGARNVIAAVLKRLAHRNPNVQLYSLVVAESLSKNCSKELHREIASRAFTQALERLITDRTTHDKVRRRILMLIAMWTEDFESDPTLGIMEECYENLKAKNYKYEANEEPPPRDDDEVRKREEEELQRVLELSIQDKGGRKNWGEYSLASSSGAGGSGSQTQINTAHQLAAAPASSSSTNQGRPPPFSSGYVPSTEAHAQAAPSVEESPPSLPPASLPTSAAPSAEVYGVTRVRALHTFEPTEPNELAFDKGDIIKVVNREYKDWWRGQLRGRTGIFPVNYVEALPEPTAAELAAEAQQEAAVFSQAANVDRLLTMLRTLDPAKDNLADNEEIQELYRSCMTLRPKIVKLIDKYSQKRADLVSMNESFVKARTIFDGMMEESLARHSEYYEQQRPAYAQPQSTIPRTESRAQGQQPLGFGRPTDQPQGYGWNPNLYDQPGYNAFPAPGAAGYPQPQQGGPIPDPHVGLGRSSSYAAAQPQVQPQPQPQPQQVQTPSQPVQQAPQPQPQTAYVQPYPAPDNQMNSYYHQQQVPQQQTEPLSRPTPAQTQTQPAGQPQGQQQPHLHTQFEPQLHHAQSQLSIQTQPQTQQSVVPQQQHQQPQTQPQLQTQTQPPETQVHPQVQAQTQQQATTMTGPPFVYDPAATYPDENVQAWAQYYAQGGTDPTGSVYFISVPGITDARASTSPTDEQQQQHTSSEPHQHHLRRESSLSLPNPYASSGVDSDDVSPASAGAASGAGGNAPWQTTLPAQFTQMRVGEPSVGA